MKANKTLEEKKAEILTNLPDCYGIITVACRKAKVGRTMFYEYMKTDVEFAFKVNEILESYTDFVESKLIELTRVGDRAAIIFYLKAKAKDRGYH